MSKWQRLIVLVGVLLIVGYVLLPVQKELYLTIWTWDFHSSAGGLDDVTLYINDQVVEGDRISWKVEQWRTYFDPQLTPTSWPPPETPPPKYDPTITEQLNYEVRVRPDNQSSQKTHTVFVRVVDGDQVSTGAFRVRAVNGRGASALYAGCRLRSKYAADKRVDATVEIQLQF